MTYYTDNKVRKYVRAYVFMSFMSSKYGKRFFNKGISASKRIKTMTKNNYESKHGKMLKKEETKVGKLAGK